MLYKVVLVICKNLLRLVYRVKVEGDISLGSVKSCIIYANHTSYLDPIVMGSFIRRQIRFMAKAELFGNSFFRYIILKLGAFPVRRGEADLRAVKTSLRLLKNGEILGMYPEGTRNKSGAPMDAEPGLSMIAIKARVPVVPIAIISSYKAFGPIRMVIGDPVYLDEFYDKKLTMEQHREISNGLMGRVYDMLKDA